MPIKDDGTVACHACGERSLDHTKSQQRSCFLGTPHIIDDLLKKRALICDVGDDMHDATLMASDGGLYCFVHQPPHTGVVVPENAFFLYVIYDKPVDYPDVFVIRRWIHTENGDIPTNDAYTADSIEVLNNIRLEMSRCGLTCIPRFADDQPAILEVWTDLDALVMGVTQKL